MGVVLALLSSIGIARITLDLNNGVVVFLTSLGAILTIILLYKKANDIR